MQNTLTPSSQISNLQLELLKLYSRNIQVQDLVEVKKLISCYFAQKAINEADACWEKQNLSDVVMDRWLAGHESF